MRGEGSSAVDRRHDAKQENGLSMKNFYTYIITNESHTTLYIGVTNDIARRMYEHKHELNDGFSKRYHLHYLVLLERHDNERAAIEREKSLKGKSRAKKIELIKETNPEWRDLSPQESF